MSTLQHLNEAGKHSTLIRKGEREKMKIIGFFFSFLLTGEVNAGPSYLMLEPVPDFALLYRKTMSEDSRTSANRRANKSHRLNIGYYDISHTEGKDQIIESVWHSGTALGW